MTLSVAQILAQSSNVGAVTIGLELGGERFSQLDRPLRLRPADRGPVPRRGAGDRAGARRILGLDDGQPADGPGPLGDADADGRRLRGDRQRRHPAPAAADREGRRRSGARAEGPAGDRRRASRRRCAKCSRACSTPGGTASEVSVPGYTLAGKTGTAQVAENGGYSETKYVASFIGFAPAQDPQLLVAVIVDEPQGEIYGGSVAAPAFGKIAVCVPSRRARIAAGVGCPPEYARGAALSVSGGAPDALPRIARVRLDELVAEARAGPDRRGRRRRDRGPRLRQPQSRARDAVLLRAGREGRRARVRRRRRSRPGRRRWWSSGSCELDVPQVVVADARAAMAPLAARFWGDPTAELRVVGVTGTNGKTTTAFLIREILEAAGDPVRAAGDGASRWSAGSRRRSSGRRRRRSTCRRPSGGCSRAATGPARWRSPRTRWPCTAPTRSTSRSRSSPT